MAVAFFCGATSCLRRACIRSIQVLSARMTPAATMRGVPGNQGGMVSPTGAHRGHGEQAPANHGSNTQVSGTGLTPCRRELVFASREPSSSDQPPMASRQQGTGTCMPVYRDRTCPRSARHTGGVASVHLSRPTRPLVPSVHTATTRIRRAGRRGDGACRPREWAGRLGNRWRGGQLPRMGSGIRKGTYPSRWTRHGNTQCR